VLALLVLRPPDLVRFRGRGRGRRERERLLRAQLPRQPPLALGLLRNNSLFVCSRGHRSTNKINEQIAAGRGRGRGRGRTLSGAGLGAGLGSDDEVVKSRLMRSIQLLLLFSLSMSPTAERARAVAAALLSLSLSLYLGSTARRVSEANKAHSGHRHRQKCRGKEQKKQGINRWCGSRVWIARSTGTWTASVAVAVRHGTSPETQNPLSASAQTNKSQKGGFRSFIIVKKTKKMKRAALDS
jgi:hypothetical protein